MWGKSWSMSGTTLLREVKYPMYGVMIRRFPNVGYNIFLLKLRVTLNILYDISFTSFRVVSFFTFRKVKHISHCVGS